MLKRIYSNARSIAGVFTAFLLACSLSYSPQVYATSPADDDIHILDSIYVGGAGDPCDQQTRTVTWSDQDWWKSSWNYQNNYDSARIHTDEFIEEFNANQLTGSGWAVSKNRNASSANMNMITIQTFSPSATLAVIDGGALQVSSPVRSLDIMLNPGSGCRVQNWNTGAVNVSAYGNYIVGQNGYLLVASDNIIYPTGYEGEQIPTTISHADLDGDGLNAAKEAAQGTSNGDVDTDYDGLNDFVESQWYPSRNSVFCGAQCAYPNPIIKDLYVEIDWMKDPSNNRSFKPSAAQLGLVKDAYLDKGILFHADTGQYGGGNELPIYIQSLNFIQNPNLFDFYDYKNGNTSSAVNFNNNRHRIWHYMISGYQFADIPGSSGAAFPGDDDLFISTGHIEDDQESFDYDSFDTALAGTIIHELGHTVCLSSQTYSGQSAGCQYSGIDTHAGTAYDSVMNYDNQMFMIDYSEGLNGSPEDHNDWAAVLGGGLKDFTDTERNDGDSAGVASKQKKDKKLARGITSQEAKELRKQGKLGGKYRELK